MDPKAAAPEPAQPIAFSLESALVAAPEGATILIPAGEYHSAPGGWWISRSVTLVGELAGDGEPAVTLRAPPGAPAISIAPGTQNVTIANISIAHEASQPPSGNSA